jgi:transposase-like protein
MRKAAYPGCCQRHPIALAGAEEYATMRQSSDKVVEFPSESSRDVLTEVLREGARKLLADAVEQELGEYLRERADLRDASGHQLVVRNGHLPERTIQTGLGDVPVKKPRVRDRRPVEEREHFESSILPRYLRRTRSVEELLPWLYLKGVSTGDFSVALQALLGPEAPGLSATTITRLKATWEQEYQEWSKRSLAGKRYAYVWADGVYFNVRLEDAPNARQCILVLMGATPDGRKELIAVIDGYRESEQSWWELLLDLRSRGLELAPELAIGDGSLGFWAALRKAYSKAREQRCWVHKTANVLNKMPKSIQPKAKSMLHNVWMAETKENAEKAFDLFLETFAAKYPGATACLAKDKDVLLTFYDFPAEHWRHIRTTNPIESTFSTVRLRTRKTKGAGSRLASLTMVFKLALTAQKKWRALNGSQLIADVIRGVSFADGVRKEAA